MNRLSRRFSDWCQSGQTTSKRSVVIVGSGYGGAVAALRYAQKGYEVFVLERGSEFVPGEFAADTAALPTFFRLNRPDKPGHIGRATGLLTWHVGKGLAAMVGNGLGGGSLVNAGIMIEPVQAVFGQSQWPATIAKSNTDSETPSLGDSFKVARQMLMSQPSASPSDSQEPVDATVPETGLPKSAALRDLAGRLGYQDRVSRVQATIDPSRCIRCGDCAAGCNVAGAKLTLADTYLAQAHQAGAKLITGATVVSIQRGSNDSGWLLNVQPTERTDLPDSDSRNSELTVQLDAGILVLAAGTFGSTEILQRSRSQNGVMLSPALGTRLSANGDSISVLANYSLRNGRGDAIAVNAVSRPRTKATEANKDDIGPTITLAMDMRHEGPLESQLLVQDGAVPAAMARAFDALIATQWTTRGLDRWRKPALFGREVAGWQSDVIGAPASLGNQSQVLLTMGHDRSAGRILWMPELNRSVPVWERPASLKTYKTQQALFDRIEQCAPKTWHLHNPLWQLLPESASVMQGAAPDPIITTVHPLGGCVMGDSFASSVVDHRARVWRAENDPYDDLLVLDGSVIPTSLGCNPLLTITALAERAMSFIPEQKGSTTKSTPPLQDAPQPIETRPQRHPAIAAVFYERLVCRELPVNEDFAKELNLNSGTADAQINLGFGHHDWDSALADARHQLQDITGTLSIRHHDGSAPIKYRLDPGLSTEDQNQFIILSETAVTPKLNTGWRRAYRLLLSATTWLVHRYWPDTKRAKALERQTPADQLARSIRSDQSRLTLLRNGIRMIWHVSAARQMEYRLRFVPEPQSNSGATLPTLWVGGFKQVQYAATSAQLTRYLSDRLKARVASFRARSPGTPVIRSRALKPSYVEQVSNPRIDFYVRAPVRLPLKILSSRPQASALFAMDPYTVMQDKPPQVGETGDLVSAMAAVLGYPAMFARFAIATRLFDFRAPDYSDSVYLDNAPRQETDLFARDGQPVAGWLQAQDINIDVQRGFHSAEPRERQDEKIKLKVWRYRARNHSSQHAPFSFGSHNGQSVIRSRSVLLMHAFSQSGLTYTFNTTRQNLAEAFIESGYEVWILESRMSTRLGLSDQPSTVDQIAQFDVPSAINHIVRTLDDELGDQKLNPHRLPVQIACFAQCIGSASLAMAQLSGRLNHDQIDNKSRPIPKLWSMMLSQVHPLIIGARESQAKSWIPPLLKQLLPQVPFAVRGPVTNVAESWADRIFASMPVPQAEHCPEETDYSTHEDNIATCRRIRFIEAPLFKHANINRQTHAILNRLFGNANLTLFSHARRFVDYEMLVDENGANRYVTVENIRNNFALPVAFFHGQVNELFDQESAHRSYDLFRSIHPYWVSFASGPIIASGYGHLDPLIGDQAVDTVYPKITGFFDQVWQQAEHDESQYRPAPPTGKPGQTARYPRVGPILGPLEWQDTQNNKTLIAPVTFAIQMASKSAICAGLESTSAWAYMARSEPQQLTIDQLDPRCCMAHGQVHIDAQRINANRCDLKIQMVVLHHSPDSKDTPVTRSTLVQAMWDQRRRVRKEQQRMDVPIPPTHSRRWRTSPGNSSSFAGDEAVWRRPVVLRREVIDAVTDPNPTQASFVIGCCRYPGVGMDRVRADSTFGKILELYEHSPQNVVSNNQASAEPSQVVPSIPGQVSSTTPLTKAHQATAPTLTFMLGDQIYADATAGMFDPTTPTERYTERYEYAFGLGTSPRISRLLRTVPTVMTPDDHEYRNGWPHEGSVATHGDEQAALDIARTTLTAYQCLNNPHKQPGSFFFDEGPCRYCIIDTRSFRQGKQNEPIRIIDPDTLVQLENWLDTADDRFVCILTGSVLLPALRNDGSPSNPIVVPEGFERAQGERNRVLDMCLSKVPGRFALISGDYHLSSAVQIRKSGQPQVLGCAIVSPPFYAPYRYINAQPYELKEHDAINTGEHQIDIAPAITEGLSTQGSGFGLVNVQRTDSGWRLVLAMKLNHYEAFTGWQSLRQFASIEMSNNSD